MSYNPYQQAPPSSQQPPFNPAAAKSKLLYPGIALTAIGVIGLFGMGVYFVVTVFLFNTNPEIYAPPPDTDPGPHYVGVYLGIAWLGINTLLQILVILGGIAMIRAKGRGLATTASVISVIPCIGSSLCLIGIPFGIWALVVLSDSNVKKLLK